MSATNCYADLSSILKTPGIRHQAQGGGKDNPYFAWAVYGGEVGKIE